MKYLIIIALAMLMACEEENPSSSVQDRSEVKYTIEELENDTNWVEITDIDTVGIVCGFNAGSTQIGSTVIRSESDFDKPKEINVVKDDCSTKIRPDIDFSKEVLIASIYGHGPATLERRIFRNKQIKEIRYIFAEKWNFNSDRNFIRLLWKESIKIRVTSDYSIFCDTLEINTGD